MIKFAFVIILVGILITTTVKNAGRLPEPVVMILLGVGLIILAGFGRRAFFKKVKSLKAKRL